LGDEESGKSGTKIVISVNYGLLSNLIEKRKIWYLVKRDRLYCNDCRTTSGLLCKLSELRSS
jgi:hypothetical protein